MRVPLLGGTYLARGIIANAQRCVNLYPEKNPQDAEAPVTHYPTPGLKLHTIPLTAGVGRCLYTATNGKLYYVVKHQVIYIDSTFGQTVLGSIPDAATPVSMLDNGLAIIIVDGTSTGYAIELSSNAFATINDPNFLGGDRVDYVDTFFVLNQPGTRNFYSSLSNCTYAQLTGGGGGAFDPTYVAAKTGFPDLLATLCVVHREVWLFGAYKTTEVWYDAGGAAFPFAIMPGVFIEHGCVAKYSVCKHDLLVFWLSIDQEGQGTVFMGAGYVARKISTPAIANMIAGWISNGNSISDAIGMMYKQGDHVFYFLTFPTVTNDWGGTGATLVYDLTEGLWHERTWTDPDTGNEYRHRANCMAIAYGVVLCADWQNGNLYELSLTTYNDYGGPIVRRRGFPHLTKELKRTTYDSFLADMECGTGSAADPTTEQTVMLRWSDDRGRTWGNPVQQTIGAQGQYLTMPQWRQLGMARDRVFELFWSADAFTALQGAYVDVTTTVAPGT